MQHWLGVIGPCLTAMMVPIQPVGPQGSSFVAIADQLQQGRSVFVGFGTRRPHSKRAAHAETGPAVLPANLRPADGVLPLVRTMWLRSPTFRRQCARLAENPSVIVTIALSTRTSNGRAQSRIAREDRAISATVEIDLRSPDLFVEYIAHELEHILEDIDGVDHPRLARQGLDGIVNIGGAYETARARVVGRKVAREVLFP